MFMGYILILHIYITTSCLLVTYLYFLAMCLFILSSLFFFFLSRYLVSFFLAGSWGKGSIIVAVVGLSPGNAKLDSFISSPLLKNSSATQTIVIQLSTDFLLAQN